MGCQGKIHSDGQREPYLQRLAGMKASGRFKKLHVVHRIWSPGCKVESRATAGRKSYDEGIHILC